MSSQSKAKPITDLDVVVDTDAHITETLDDILPYIDDKYEGIRRLIENTANPLYDIYTLGHPLPPFLHSRDVFGGDIYSGGSTNHVDAKLDQMDEFDIDYGIINPTLNLAISTVNNTRCAVALANAYNSWLVDQFLDEDPRLRATIVVAPQKPDRAAEEIDRVANEDGFVGVFVPATGLVPSAGHTWYDPIYEAAERHGLPVFFHSVSSATSKAFPVQYEWNETFAEDHTIGHPFSHMWNLTTMIFQGVPERFPDLEFVYQEAGIGWIPYFLWRLDDHYMELTDELPILERLPSEYIRDQFHFSTQPLGHTSENNEHLSWMIRMVGPELLMYASDVPHYDFDPPRELYDRIDPYFDDDVVRGMMGETAAELFDFR